jgi:tRNA 2-thiouridine synthesizing protein A
LGHAAGVYQWAWDCRYHSGGKGVGTVNLILVQRSADAHLAGMSETLLDVKGMNCPLPVLKANRTLRGMAAGERLRILATDRAAVADFQAFCRETGHALLAWSEESGVFSFVIRRRVDDPEKKGS